MKISSKSNFNFSKLSTRGQFKKIFEDSTLAISTAIAKSSQKNILNNLKPELAKSTIKNRQEGKSSFKGHNKEKNKTFETRPLLYTEKLKNSIKGNKKGLRMERYGLEHIKGFGNVPARPFIADLEDNKESHVKVQNFIVNKINKAIK